MKAREKIEAGRFPLHRLTAFGRLSEAEAAYLVGMVESPVAYAARRTIRSQGEPNRCVFMLRQGWAVSSIGFADRSRQIVKVHLPGDFLGVPSLPFAEAVETLSTLTPAIVCRVPLEGLGDLFAQMPRLAARMFLAAQEERVTLMDRLAALGRLGAMGSVAALLVHLYDRLSMIEPMASTHIQVPLTQGELGDILGLTSVHVNRVLRAMERTGDLRRNGRTFDLLDLDKLRALSGIPRRDVKKEHAWLPD